jgi:hypothetical protein
MAHQPPHEKNANVFHEVEKASRDTIQLTQRVVKNKRSNNPQLLPLENPAEIVSDLSDLVSTLLDIAEEQGVVRIAWTQH